MAKKAKYRVRGGNITEEIEAANSAEAQRKFLANRAEAANAGPLDVQAIETLPTDEPPKHRYKVVWGPEEKIVEAVHEDDAWSQFVGGDESSQAWKYPNLYPRIITPLDDEGNVEADSGVRDGRKQRKTKRGTKAGRAKATRASSSNAAGAAAATAADAATDTPAKRARVGRGRRSAGAAKSAKSARASVARPVRAGKRGSKASTGT